jgi:hypothetical protein
VRVNRVESYFEVESTKGRIVPISTRRCLNDVRCLCDVRKGREGGGQGTGSDDLGHESGRRKGCSDGPVDAPETGGGAKGHPTGLEEGDGERKEGRGASIYIYLTPRIGISLKCYCYSCLFRIIAPSCCY